MEDEDTKEVIVKLGKRKGAITLRKRLEKATEVVEAEQVSSGQKTEVLRGEHGRLLPGTASPAYASKRRGIAARIEALWPDMDEFAVGVGKGEIPVTREQMTMLKDLMDRRWGRSPETHLVGGMDSEHRDAVAALSKDQLLGLLDSGTSATESAALLVEGTVISESTD